MPEIKNAFMINVKDPQKFIDEKINSNPNINGCVLPEGPITIPIIKNEQPKFSEEVLACK